MNKSAKIYQFVTPLADYYTMGGGASEEEKMVEKAMSCARSRAYLSCQLSQSRAAAQQMNVMLQDILSL